MKWPFLHIFYSYEAKMRVDLLETISKPGKIAVLENEEDIEDEEIEVTTSHYLY